MNKQYITKITDDKNDYSWMQRSEPQWKGLIRKELFQQFLLAYPFAVLSANCRSNNVKNVGLFSVADKFYSTNTDFLKGLKVNPITTENFYDIPLFKQED